MVENAKTGTTSCPRCGSESTPGRTCCALLDDPNQEIPLMARLVRDKSGQPFDVTTRWVRIGRDETNQIVLEQDLFASRFHAWITYEESCFWIEDLGSTNGTLLNGQTLDRRELLANGDKIKVGETELTFLLLEKTG